MIPAVQTPQRKPHGGRDKGAALLTAPRAGARLHKTHPVSSTATAFRFGAIHGCDTQTKFEGQFP